MGAIPILDHLKKKGGLFSTAGCGKPHVRWCGRGDGHYSVTSTRSTNRTIQQVRVGLEQPSLGGGSS